MKLTSDINRPQSVGRVNDALRIAWDLAPKALTAKMLADAYMHSPRFAGKSHTSVRTSAQFDFMDLRKTGMFDAAKYKNKGDYKACLHLRLHDKYREMPTAPQFDVGPQGPEAGWKNPSATVKVGGVFPGCVERRLAIASKPKRGRPSKKAVAARAKAKGVDPAKVFAVPVKLPKGTTPSEITIVLKFL